MQLSIHFELTLNNSGNQTRRAFPLKVSFESPEMRTVIFGPSGCGKSITLQAIAGLIKPDSGRIQLGTRTVYERQSHTFVPARNRRIGYVFQDYALFPHLSVLENAGYALRRWPLPLSQAEKNRVMEMLELVHMADLAGHLPHELSGGQRQRVALVRALINQPDLLLLDEPFSAMDMLLRVKMRAELMQIQKRFNIPMIMITHDLEDVNAFADTLVVYQKGSVATILPCRAQYQTHGVIKTQEEIRKVCTQVFETL